MAKVVNEDRIKIEFILTQKEGVALVFCSADYEVNADDLSETRSLDIELTANQENLIKNFGSSVLQSIKQKESKKVITG